MKPSHARRYGFTLIELLVVMGISTILAGLLLPVLARAKGSARLTQCGNNLRQIGLATSLYASDHRVFPLFSHYGRPPVPSSFWSDRLQPYTHQSWAAGEVYRCPAYPEGNRTGVFIDNHIEPSKPERLFATTDEDMSRWNNDHQPHREDLRHWGE